MNEMNEMNNVEMTTGTEVINRGDIAGVDIMESLKNPTTNFLCTIEDDGTRKSKVAIYNAINSSDTALNDMVGKPLDIVDVVAHPITITDEETGEIIETVRTVLIDKDGKCYHAVSAGILNSLQKIFSIIGMPSWKDEPVKMEVKQVKTRNGNNKVNTLVLL